jgi:hypothetical protein
MSQNMDKVAKHTDKFQKVLEATQPGRWKIVGIIGHGSFGAVYKVQDKNLRTVAIKSMWAHPSIGKFTPVRL